MTETDIAVRYALAFVLIGGGIAGILGSLLGVETIEPGYLVAVVAMGAAALPKSLGVCGRFRSLLP